MYDIDLIMHMRVDGGFPKCFDNMSLERLKESKETLEKLIKDHQEKISEYRVYLKYVKEKLEDHNFITN